MQDDEKFKGAGFKTQVDIVKQLFKDEGLEKIKENASEDLKAHLERKIMDTEWIPERISAELSEKADKVLGRGDGALMRRIGYHIAIDNLKGVYKAFVKLTNIKSLLRRANVVWKKYYSHGWIETVDEGKNHFTFEVVGKHPYPSTCPGVLGFVDAVVEVYKVKGKVTHTECKIKGDKRCVFHLEWK
jgi:hypothetical protein